MFSPRKGWIEIAGGPRMMKEPAYGSRPRHRRRRSPGYAYPHLLFTNGTLEMSADTFFRLSPSGLISRDNRPGK